MGQWIACIVIVAAAVLSAPWLLDELRRTRRGGGAGTGAALLELDRILNPSTEHTIAARQETVKEDPGKGDPPADDDDGTPR